MSQQTVLDKYFKTKASASSGTCDMKTDYETPKKRSLSLVKVSPAKTTKCSREDDSVVIIETSVELVDLCVDDDECDLKPEKMKRSIKCNLNEADSSQESVTPIKTLPLGVSTKSQKFDTNEECDSDSSVSTIPYSLTPSTPQKSLSRSPYSTPSRTREKFYSPNKKRGITKQTIKKKNLTSSFSQPKEHCSIYNQIFNEACEGMDDKTVYLLSIIHSCLKNDSLKHLLDENSQNFLCNCLKLPKPGMRLVCRLYWRQEGWYRMQQLTDIILNKKDNVHGTKLHELIDHMKNVGFLLLSSDGEHEIDFEGYTKILKLAEYKAICKKLKLIAQSKTDAIRALRSYSQRKSISRFFTSNTNTNADDNSRRVLEILKSTAGPCYKLSELARSTLYKLYVLMYLGMNYSVIREKRLELMLLNEKTMRETYPIDKEMIVDDASVVFKNSREFDRFLEAHCLYEEFLAETKLRDKCVIISRAFQLYNAIRSEEMTSYKALPLWLRRFTPSNIYIKLLEEGVQELKKHKETECYSLALDILNTLISQNAFRQHNKANWYAEKALILHKHLDRRDEAAELLLEAFVSNLSDEAKDSLKPRAKLIANQKNAPLKVSLKDALLSHANKDCKQERNLKAEHIYKQPMDNVKKGKIMFETHTADGKMYQTAEEYCIMHYTNSEQFTHGEHWEGKIIVTIFFLLFWDIIYSKPRGINGIFLSHYQVYPLDMHYESFYINRKALIDDWLKKIETTALPDLLEIMQLKWEQRPECELSGISRGVGWEGVCSVAACLGARGLAAVCARLARDYHYSHSGFPDLTLWNVHTKQIKFVEVKTDSDKPSIKQIQWMHYLSKNGIDTEFCYVGTNTTRQKSRSNH